MDFSNATILSVSRKSEFWGETTRYKSTLDLSIEGLLLNLTNSEGVDGIIQQLKSLVDSATNWQEIVINGVSFGNGIINSVNFSEGNDVRQKKYTIAISIPIQGDLSTVFSGDYTGLQYENAQYIEGFSESSSYDRSIQKENYTQSITFSIKGPYSLNAVNAAKSLATNFFQYNDLLNTIGNKYSNSTIFRKFYNESYDQINNRFTFSRNYETSLNSNGQYSSFFSHSLSFDNAGIASIKEKADYIGHTSTPFDTVVSQAKTDLASSYTRCNQIFSIYFDADNATLLSNPITKSWVSVPLEGKITYEVQYTNSNRVTDFGCFWSYQINVDKSLGGNYIITESGEIVGFGHIIDLKYNNALSAWDTIQSESRIQQYYPGARSLNKVTETLTLQKVQGKIVYSEKYSDSDSISSSTDIRKTLVTVSNQFNRHLATSFSIINNKEIIQVQPNLLPNTISYTVNMNGRATVPISTYLGAAVQYVSVGANSFISDVSYSYDPFSRSFSLNVSVTSLP